MRCKIYARESFHTKITAATATGTFSGSPNPNAFFTCLIKSKSILPLMVISTAKCQPTMPCSTQTWRLYGQKAPGRRRERIESVRNSSKIFMNGGRGSRWANFSPFRLYGSFPLSESSYYSANILKGDREGGNHPERGSAIRSKHEKAFSRAPRLHGATLHA